MRIDGAWYLCDDGVLRPVIRGAIQTGDGTWCAVLFLIDSAADRTVLSANILNALGMSGGDPREHLEGVGGKVATVFVESQIRLKRETGEWVTIKSRFAAFADPTALEMSVLGRDLTNLFALIIDRPQEVVCLLGQNHRYQIVQT